MADTSRSQQFNMRVNDEERERLDLVADHFGVDAADALRLLLKREAEGIRAAQGDRPTRRSIVRIVFSEREVTDDVLAIRLRSNVRKTAGVARELARAGIFRTRVSTTIPNTRAALGGVTVYERRFDSVAETLEAMVKDGFAPDELF